MGILGKSRSEIHSGIEESHVVFLNNLRSKIAIRRNDL